MSGSRKLSQNKFYVGLGTWNNFADEDQCTTGMPDRHLYKTTQCNIVQMWLCNGR